MSTSTATRLEIRPCEPGRDYEQYVDLYNSLMGDIWTTSVDELTHWKTIHPDNYLMVGAFEGSEIVGLCDVNWRTWNPEAPTPAIEMAVAASRRRQGIGQAMYEWISRWTREREPGGDLLDTMVVDDGRSADAIEFWQRRGFSVTEHHKHVALDLAAVETAAPFEPEGVSITTFAERPDLMPSAYEMFALAIKDIPGDDVQHAMPYEQWLRTELELPGYRADSRFIAVERSADGAERVVGWASLETPPQQPGVAWHGMTAVHPEARGRKIALALKLHTIQWARDHGIHTIKTDNEERNAPMRHINIKLGYAPAPSLMKMRGPLWRP